ELIAEDPRRLEFGYPLARGAAASLESPQLADALAVLHRRVVERRPARPAARVREQRPHLLGRALRVRADVDLLDRHQPLTSAGARRWRLSIPPPHGNAGCEDPAPRHSSTEAGHGPTGRYSASGGRAIGISSAAAVRSATVKPSPTR